MIRILPIYNQGSMDLQTTIEQDLRNREPGLPDEVYRDQARRYMGVALGSKMKEIIHGVFGDDLRNMIEVRRSSKKLARDLIYSSTHKDAKQRIFREKRKDLVGRYPDLDAALGMREVRELVKTAGSAIQLVHKAELAAAKRELREAREKGRPRLEAQALARVERMKGSGRIFPVLLRGGPRTVGEHEMFLAHFT